MNTERLHAIAVAVLDDLESTKTVETLGQLVDALQNQVSQPAVPQFQQTVSDLQQTLYDALLSAPSNDFSPTWKKALEELGLSGFLGENLQAKVREIFGQNQITPSVASEELQTLNTELSEYKTALEYIVSGFKQMDIGAEGLEPGQCEIGVLMPRSAVKNKLREFADDLEDLNGIFGAFSELITGRRPGFEIRSVSSSDFNIFLVMVPTVAITVVTVVDRIVNTYKNILEIRKRHAELSSFGLTKKELSGVQEHANSRMKTEIEKLVDELLEKNCKGKDQGRQNELKIELSFCLNRIANRVDMGYGFEVRARPLTDDEAAEKKVSAQDKAHIDAIHSVAKNIEFLKLEGPPILSLPKSQGKKKKKSDKVVDQATKKVRTPKKAAKETAK